MQGMKGTIYIIRNKINEKVYIGQTSLSPHDRFKQHLKPSTIKRYKYKIYRAMNKYGSENFYMEVLQTDINLDELNSVEIEYIEEYDSFNNGYNSTKGGDGRHINKIKDIGYIIECIKKGKLLKDIASDLGVNPSTVTRALESRKIDYKSMMPKNRKINALRSVNREEVKRLYLSNHTHSKIAAILDIDQRSVSRVVKEFKINKTPRYDYNNIKVAYILNDIYDNKTRMYLMEKYSISSHVYYQVKKLIKN